MNVLIHIGYPKAASTLLQHYFSAHPSVFYTGAMLDKYKRTGEVDIHAPVLSNEQTHLVISEEQLSVWRGNLDIVGIKFKDYDIAAQQKKTALQLHSAFPAAKILIVTRGFVSALHAMYSQYVSIGGILIFPEFEKHFGKIMAQFYDYTYLIKLYRSVFGEENVVVLPFEMLKENPSKFIALLNSAANLPAIEFDIAVKNASLEKEEAESYRKLSLFIYRAIQWLPYSVQQKIYGLYVYLLYSRKLHSLTGIFSSKVEAREVNAQTLSLFRGKADILRSESLFAPYSKEYLF